MKEFTFEKGAFNIINVRENQENLLQYKECSVILMHSNKVVS